MGLGIGRSNDGQWVLRSASWNARTKEVNEIVHFKAQSPEVLKRDVEEQLQKVEKEIGDLKAEIDSLEDTEVELYAMLEMVEEVSSDVD